MQYVLILTCSVLLALGSQVQAAAPQMYPAKIGTGSINGSFYPIGQELCTIINAKMRDNRVRMTAEITAGSVDNASKLGSQEVSFGLVQALHLYKASQGQGPWQGKPLKDLRIVLSLDSANLLFMAADDSNINAVGDLKGKVVSVGQPDSGHRSNALDLLAAAGIDPAKDLKDTAMKPTEVGPAMESKAIDAFFFAAGHPNNTMRYAAAGSRKVHFVPLSSDVINRLLTQTPGYVATTVPIKYYPGVSNSNDPATVASRVFLCTRADVPDEVVYAVAKEVYGKIGQMKTQDPGLDHLNIKEIAADLPVPMHPGAEQYFKESGLL